MSVPDAQPASGPATDDLVPGTPPSTPPLPGEPAASPPATRRLLPSMLVASLTLFATYAGLIAILLPTQVQVLFGEAHKEANLAIVTTTSFVFTLFAQPLAGAFSDRTRSRLGRRAPWMVLGALVGGILLFGLGSLRQLVLITVFWVVIQVALNFLQSPLTTITADRFPRVKRGGASAMIGLGTQLGATIGVMIASALAAHFGVAYSIFGAAVIVVTLLFVLFNRDWSSKGAAVAPWSWAAFFKGFWVNPRKHPDYAWAFGARFLLVLGYFVVSTYQLYLLQNYIGLSLSQAQGAVLTLTLVAFVPTLVAIALSGWWSDRLHRRKIFIYVASAIMAVAYVMPLIMTNMTGMIVMSILNGIGFGVYMSVDAALMTEVLPSESTAAGKDLGILNVATNIPQALSPSIALLIISALGGYGMLFVFAIVFVIAAAVVTAPIKGVR